ncbi:hypothetical protein D3C71_1742570 [compost metagenome]
MAALQQRPQAVARPNCRRRGFGDRGVGRGSNAVFGQRQRCGRSLGGCHVGKNLRHKVGRSLGGRDGGDRFGVPGMAHTCIFGCRREGQIPLCSGLWQ